MKLTQNDKNRYSRHLLLDEVGEQGQEKLKQAKVLVIGAGGLGCPVLMYLCAAGVGNLAIIDFDVVDETNLQRQVLFDTHDIGKSKALTAQKKLSIQNPLIQITAYNEKLTNKNALDLFSKYDIIIDGSDNFSTRYMVNDACMLTNKPLVYGAIHRFEGQVSVFNYNDGPNYRCLFPEPPSPDAPSVSCADVGVLGVLPGIIGAQQANEAIKIILGIGDVLAGTLLIYNALHSSYLRLKIVKAFHLNDLEMTLSNDFIHFDYSFSCANNPLSEISKQEFVALPSSTLVLDVRESWEQPQVKNKELMNFPLDDLEDFVEDIPKDKPVYVVCQRGARSQAAIDYLKKTYGFSNLINVKNGMLG